MNNYNIDYMNYLNGIPSNFFPSYDYINNIDNKNDLFNSYDGFVRGNMFSNLFNPYKNYKVGMINPNNEKEALLYQLMEYNFALIDLGLYLDVNPKDINMLNLFNKYLDVEKQLIDKYEKSYGPLELCSDSASFNGTWNWDNNPWPWEGDK